MCAATVTVHSQLALVDLGIDVVVVGVVAVAVLSQKLIYLCAVVIAAAVIVSIVLVLVVVSWNFLFHVSFGSSGQAKELRKWASESS